MYLPYDNDNNIDDNSVALRTPIDSSAHEAGLLLSFFLSLTSKPAVSRWGEQRLKKGRLESISTLFLSLTSPHSPLRTPECGESMFWISSLKPAVVIQLERRLRQRYIY